MINLKQTIKNLINYILAFLKWSALGIVMGVLCGLTGAGFSKSISLVTGLREQNPWLLFLLIPCGILTVLLYKLCKVDGLGTNAVFDSVRDENKVTFKLAPAIFVSSVLTHLSGGSAGKEGAALQLGGSISSVICRALKLDEKTRHILTMSGMGALFSAVFGTPLGACVFALEVVNVGYFCSAALFPSLVSSVVAFSVSTTLGTPVEKFSVGNIPAFSFNTMWRIAVVAIIGAVVGILFCASLHIVSHLFDKAFKNAYIKIAVGGALIIVLTLLTGSFKYNGGGMDTIASVFEHGTVEHWAFLIKILFTAITVAAGFKGGEIVPTMFVGVTLGSLLSLLVGLPVPLSAAIGLVSMFCAVTNCPLATILLAIEMFGSEGAIFYAIAVAISFLLSGKFSLYSSQHFIYSKLNELLEEN